MRIGIGYDIHPLADGRRLVLGGIVIPHAKGLVGHSDADALVHAVCDAMLGAMGKGDMGTYFPSSDPRYKDIDSLALLREVGRMLAQHGYRVVNVDAVVIAQAPRLGPHLGAMAEQIAKTLGVSGDVVNVKVKSGEGIDAIGREEAMAAQAVCLIEEEELTS